MPNKMRILVAEGALVARDIQVSLENKYPEAIVSLAHNRNIFTDCLNNHKFPYDIVIVNEDYCQESDIPLLRMKSEQTILTSTGRGSIKNLLSDVPVYEKPFSTSEMVNAIERNRSAQVA